MRYYVYIIRCADDYIYVGLTRDIEKRLKQHRDGLCRNTKNRRPLNLVYNEIFLDKLEAARREREIKGWNRMKKELLIRNSLH